jgi:hypothetical protein
MRHVPPAGLDRCPSDSHGQRRTPLVCALRLLYPAQLKTRDELVERFSANRCDNRIPPQKEFLYRDLRHPDHRVPRHKLCEFCFAHILGPCRALRQDQVTHLCAAIPHADLYRLV